MTGQHKFYILPAVYALLVKDHKVFLLRRANTAWANGNFTAPAGHVEAGETPVRAAVRELFEEAGVRAEEKDLEMVYTIFRKSNIDTYAELIFMVSKWEGEPKNNEPEKCDSADWFDLDDLPETTHPFLKIALADIQSGKKKYLEYNY